MLSKKQLFLTHVAQTSEEPMCFEITEAAGIYLTDTNGKRYYDMNSGIAVSSVGHSHPKVVAAVQDQAAKYMHTMVYGEHIQSPQVLYASKLISLMDSHFQSIYFLMAGTEATEVAMKIAKRYTGRYEIISAKHAYHGSTHGSESLRSDEEYKSAFMPLLPGIRHIDFNSLEDIDKISCRTACVIMECVQGEAGVILPQKKYLQAVKQRCQDVGALFILDEIQSGFGRTGHLFAHQKYDIVPDLLLIGKAMGGGMPLSGVVSSKEIMNCLIRNPVLGHITTFGGHPVSCAAALASLEVLLEEKYIEEVADKEALIKRMLQHNIINDVRSAGLMMAVELTDVKYLFPVVNRAFAQGVIIDWFLFNDRSFRLAPPLIATKAELTEVCTILLDVLNFVEEMMASH